MFVHYIIFTGMVQSKKGKTRWMAPKECKYVWKKCLRRGKLTWPISTTLPKSMVSVGYGSFFVLHLVSRLPSTQLSGPNFFFFVWYIYRYIVNERSDGIKPRADAARTLPRMITPSMLNCWVLEILSMMKDVGWVDIRKAGMGVGVEQVQILMAKHTSMCAFERLTFSPKFANI